MLDVSLLQSLRVASVHVPQKNPRLRFTSSTCHRFLMVILQWILGFALKVQMQRITLSPDISREVKRFRVPFKAFQPLIATQEIEVEMMAFPLPRRVGLFQVCKGPSRQLQHTFVIPEQFLNNYYPHIPVVVVLIVWLFDESNIVGVPEGKNTNSKPTEITRYMMHTFERIYKAQQ